MGGMGDFLATKEVQFAGRGAAVGMQIGGSIASAQYNAAAMRAQADALEQQSKITAYLIRKQYEKEYRTVLERQQQQQSMNRVVAMKRGIAGASAVAVMGSYAAKGQRNLEELYYNAAMQTGKASLQATNRAAGLRERARQYDWQASSALIGGVIGLGASMLDLEAKDPNAGDRESPVNALHKEESLNMENIRSTFYGADNSSSFGLPRLA